MPIEFLGIDTETSGLNHLENQVLDICLLKVDSNFEVKEELSVFAFPDEDAVLDPLALKVNGYSAEAWTAKNAVSQVDMFEQVYAFIRHNSRLKLIAHNVPFDAGFLKQMFVRHGKGKTEYHKLIDYHALDTMGIAMFLDFVQTGKARKSYKLASLIEDYGITNDFAHTAQGDVHACLQLLQAMKAAARGTLEIAPGAMKNANRNNYSHIIMCVNLHEDVWHFHHGKYEGRVVSNVVRDDPGYIRVVLAFPDLSPEQRAYLEKEYKTQHPTA